jgi:5'-nucleotidase
MAASNTCVDMVFGGHDHCYYSALNPSTDVFVLKSGTDFECFTNLTVLFGVEKYDQEKLQSDNVSVFFSEKLKRLYISEKVMITDEFLPDPEIEKHVLKYS